MENYIYMLEFFVETITFSSNLPEYPLPHEVRISGDMGNYIRMEVISLQASVPENEPQKDLKLCSGKSTLFACTQEDFLQKMNVDTFTINLFVKQKHVASAPIGLPKDFYSLVKQANEKDGVMGPVSIQDQFLLKEDNSDRIMGDIKAAVRLSSFGANIQTSFQLISTEMAANKKFLVRGARGDSMFECQKINPGYSGEVLPLTPLFKGKESPRESLFPGGEDERLSWMALFKSTLDPKISVPPEEFNIAITSMFDKKTASNITFDIVSLMERPEENKHIDLRIRGGSKGFVFEFDTSRIEDSRASESTELTSTIEDEDQLTVERLNKLLCKNRDCPAARKFKELGIGPLAIHKGLGAVYGEPSLPVTYGLSQTYGVFDEYGPYGLFSRPKRPSQSFVPKKESDWQSSCWKPRKRKERECLCQKSKYDACCCKPQKSPLRLTGGDAVSSSQECEDKYHQVLRLTGGGVLDYDDVKSPFHECKEIMDQYDEVLKKYKKALGPCGMVTCPFAPNVTKESCKQMCSHGLDVYSASNIVPGSTPKEEESCPSPKTSTAKPKGACGSAKCAYAKYKQGLVDQDVDIEMATLPPSKRSCGHPKCPVEPDLPPIHWDCPDPLPKGKCKNPNCPYLPKEIKCLNAVLNKGLCGNFNCPYAPPDPCSSPYCPFQPRQCPYEADSDSYCGNSECPFAPKKENDTCDNPQCPYAAPPCNNPCPPVPCVNPLLAYCALMSGDQQMLQMCFGGPNCPYNMQNQQSCPASASPPSTNACSDKGVAQKPSPCYQPVESTCGNPNCPHAKKTECSQRNGDEEEKKEGSIEYTSETRVSVDNAPCHPGTCKYQAGDELECEPCCKDNKKVNELCGNPDCPFNVKTCFIKPPPCYEPPENEDVCGNPDCPYAPKPPCGSPVCPGRSPPCPASSPPCPGLVPPCGIPFPCPFGLDPITALLSMGMPISICPDGTCPYPTKDTIQVCYAVPPCPGAQPPQACAVEEKGAKDDDVCDNPECPYAGDSTSQKRDLGEVCTTGAPDDPGALVAGETEYKSDTRLEVDMAPCTKQTCQSTGGTLVCDVCPCAKGGGEAGAGKAKVKATTTTGVKRRKKKSKSKYVYSVGDKYPGVQIGHRECVMPAFNVPPKMGWLWNVFTPCLQLKPRRGWRPGALTKTIAERLRDHRAKQGLPMLEVKAFRAGKKGFGQFGSSSSVNVTPKPTLHVKKHDGCYWITMNPLKDPHTLVENENPYMECTPLQFKITKNKDKEENDEYRSCFCGDEVVESSSSDSELEIEFTPPAGIIHPERFKKKRNVVHTDTQYLDSDIKPEKSKTEVKGKGKKGKGKKEKGKKGKKGKKK